MLTVIGLGVFALAFGGVQWRTAVRWRYLAQFYAGEARAPIKERTMQTVVLLGLGGSNALKGIVKIGVHHEGISFRVLTPFSMFHQPLFVPFSEISGWSTTWYLNAKSNEFKFQRARDVQMVMCSEQAEWIRSHSGENLIIHDRAPVAGNAGRGARALSMAIAAMSVLMLGWLSVLVISQ